MSSNLTVPSIVCPDPVLAAGKQGLKRVAVNDATAQLLVTFWGPVTSAQAYLLSPLSYSLSGGQRLFPRVIEAEAAGLASPPVADSASVLLTLDQLGDFSVYTLTVSGADIDPFFSSAKLRFRLACDDSFDCRLPSVLAPSAPELQVNIDYLTKDYAGFRQALLDFIPTRLPAWSERSEADLGMTLLELFAATADNLSYLQDRIANEAFLSTATQRRSVAGHLALIGYQMDEGASASTWLQFRVNAPKTLPANPGFKVSNNPSASSDPVAVFETLGEARLDPAHNQMALYDWGNSDCCLKRQALTAALVGSFDRLRAGDYLLFEDDKGNCDVVRLTAPPAITQVAPVTSPPSSSPGDFITVVAWSAVTPLSQAYCVAHTTVRGNVVPATHGETVTEVGSLPAAPGALSGPTSLRPPRLRLNLSQAPLAHLDPKVLALGAPLAAGSPAAAVNFTDRPARSISTLRLEVSGTQWQERNTLLESGPADQVFRLEIDDSGKATIVFGDGTFGQQPPFGAPVSLIYRVGGGSAANIGAKSLTLARPSGPAAWLDSVTNPLPVTGGRDLESGDHARRVGPQGFHQPMVAVTPADYQTAATSFTDASGAPLIQRANADFRWTGSWLTVTLAVDPVGVEGLTPQLEQALRDYLGTKRLSGYDLEIVGPSYVPVDLQIEFTPAPGSFPSHVQQALLVALSNRSNADGSHGFFHPDNFTFGGSLFVSAIYAAVMAAPGVQSAQITRLARLHAEQPDQETTTNLGQGFLAIGHDQIIRLDNDRNFPQNGTLAVVPKGASA